MKAALFLVVLAACGDPKSKVDASIQIVDSPKPVDAPKPIDAAVDAPPDATPMNVVTACTNACNALAACFMMPADPTCNMECAEDLADCTAQQVATIDACSTQPCGDIANEMSPLLDCIVAVPCVEMAAPNPSSLFKGSRK